ncbi:hypothetical protein [Desulfurella sp.]|uniref:hypothetical protein n=1 Tax=Desulfurella sp. TaxID=1962857 RepID=UPI0025C0F031|nr:hypothetical protein [Desulfurella sp.]
MERLNKPLLYIPFKRLQIVAKVFEQIGKVKPYKLYIFSDGPRNEEEKIKVNKVRSYIINNIDWDCEVKTMFMDKNLGAAFGVNSAIEWFFSNEDEGIVLEEDCLPSDSFFRFCSELLDLYRDNKQVGIIQGFNPFPKENYPYSYWFSKYDIKWGWATWKDRWQYQDIYTKDWQKVRKTDFLDKVSNNNIMIRLWWSAIFDEIHRHPNITWDTQFTYQFLKRDLLALTPKNNLIIHIGYGDEAYTAKFNIPNYIRNLGLQEIEFPLTHPRELITDSNYDKLVEKIHYEIGIPKVLRLQIKNILDSNKYTRDTILPVLKNIYKKYRK